MYHRNRIGSYPTMMLGCLLTLSLCLLSKSVLAQGQPPHWVTEGPSVNQRELSLEMALEVMATKLYVEVDLGGQPRRFVYDTGSPSMIDARLATELGLAVVDTRTGTDAHGTKIESQIVQADLGLGGVMVEKVPMFVADFSGRPATQCLIGDGVLGSEILPLCAWQIDLSSSTLRCETDLEKLSHLEPSNRQPLSTFGYPHTPYLDVRFAADARSKAMFDTGAAPILTLSPQDFEGARQSDGIVTMREGYGSAGASLGGQAADRKQLQVRTTSFSVGNVALGEVDAMLRTSAPSLVGASMLEQYIVTLDVRSESAWFAAYRDAPTHSPSFGFSLAYDDPIRVSLVWEDSPASQAGLTVGQELTGINGRSADSSCGSIQHALNAMSGDRIELKLNEQQLRLERSAWGIQ